MLAEKSFKKEEISKDQFLVYVKRLNALDKSYVHSIVIDYLQEYLIINEEEHLTIAYHVITTKSAEVDFGGPNKFKPQFLYYEETTNTTYYTIPLTYVQTLKRVDFNNDFLLSNELMFKNDTNPIKNQLASSIKKMAQSNDFCMLDVNKKCLNILPSDVIPDEKFPKSPYNEDLTGFVNYLVDLKNVRKKNICKCLF